MRLLFIHRNFPGQFLHLARQLAAQNRHAIVFITEPNGNHIPGISKATYRIAGCATGTHPDTREFEIAMQRAAAVAGIARQLHRLDFTPDAIIGHEGWGEMLHLPDIWPAVPRIGYQEFYYNPRNSDVDFDPEFPPPPDVYARIRAKNAVNLISLNNGGRFITPTPFQRATYPDWAQSRITLLPEGVDLQRCRPDPSARPCAFQIGAVTVLPDEVLITYVARDLEPYRGFHVFMRALPRILREHARARVVIVGGDGISYGSDPGAPCWRERMLRELAGQIDPDRLHFTGTLDHARYLTVLRRSDLHVYLTYPFVASWSLREALACGCAILASDTAPVRDFITDGENGVLVPCLDPARLADAALELLADSARRTALRAAARIYAETHLPIGKTLADYAALIGIPAFP